VGERGLLTEEALSWVGMEIELPPGEVTARGVRQYIAGCGGEVAFRRAAGPAEADVASVPPLMYQALTGPVSPRHELTEDGSTGERRPPIGEGQGMAGETDVQFHRPLRIGDVLTGSRRLASLDEKHGTRRHFVVATWVTEYRDDSGELVISETFRQLLF
jgi:hydroxyacyl-ACP dehydratase HTD2-like protein with hotdog domain